MLVECFFEINGTPEDQRRVFARIETFLQNENNRGNIAKLDIHNSEEEDGDDD